MKSYQSPELASLYSGQPGHVGARNCNNLLPDSRDSGHPNWAIYMIFILQFSQPRQRDGRNKEKLIVEREDEQTKYMYIII